VIRRVFLAAASSVTSPTTASGHLLIAGPRGVWNDIIASYKVSRLSLYYIKRHALSSFKSNQLENVKKLKNTHLNKAVQRRLEKKTEKNIL